MTPNRIVALLTPLVFAPLAGACATWLAKNFPGIKVNQNDLQSIFIAGALIALAPAVQWLHGWQKYEARQAEAEQAVEVANAAGAAAAIQPEPAAAQADLGDLGDLGDLDGLEDLGDDLDGLGLDDLADDFDDELLPEEEPSLPGS
jgi:hypothetical protein